MMYGEDYQSSLSRSSGSQLVYGNKLAIEDHEHRLPSPEPGESVSLSSTLPRIAGQADGTSTLQSLHVAQVVPTSRPSTVSLTRGTSSGIDNTESGSSSGDEDSGHLGSRSRNYRSFRLNTLEQRQRQARVTPNSYATFRLQQSNLSKCRCAACCVFACVCVCVCVRVCVHMCMCMLSLIHI